MFDYTEEPGLVLNNRFVLGDDRPLISIITPYYNAGKYFEQTYRSLLNQTFPYFEWIIVNDGSTNPGEAKFLENLTKEDPRIRLYHIDNGGAARARNFAVKQTTTDIFIPADADDLFEPTFLEYLYFALKCNPDVAWAYTSTVAFYEQEYLWDREFSSDIMKAENVCCNASAVRKEAFEEVGGYIASSRNLYEDWRLWLKLLAKNHYPVHIRSHLFWYRILREGALSAINQNERLKQSVLQEIHELAKTVPDGIKAKTFDGPCELSYQRPNKWDWNLKLKFEKEKTRILMLIPHMERGGADKFNIDVLENIDKEKYEIGVITTLKSNNEWRQLFTQHAQEVFVLSDFLDRKEWSAFIHYYIASRGVDIVLNISSYIGYAMMPWLRKEFPEIGLIDCVHAEGKYWRDGGYPRKSAAVDSVLEKTFVTNEYTRQIMVNRYGKKPEKVETIYTGVDENYFQKNGVSGDEVKEKLKLDSDRPVVLFLCRICDEKRPFLMLEIADKMRGIIPNICFMVIGDGPLLHDLKQTVAQRGLASTIYVLDKQADVRPYYAAGDIFLICSIKEGLAITTFEAMLMGLPVVSADVGGQKELVTDKTGRLVPCLQDENLDFGSRIYTDQEINYYTDAIADLLSDKNKLRDMREKCREKVLDGFTLKTMIKKIEAEFDRLKSGNGLTGRIELSNTLSKISDITDDYLTISSTYENLEFNNYLIWTEFRNQLNSMRECENQLNQIKILRSYRMIEKYHRLLDNSRMVRFFDKWLRFFGKGLRKIYRAFKAIRSRRKRASKKSAFV